jgi:RNA polymerase sigma factor (sigma-70 family)
MMLARLARAGDIDARSGLVEANLRLVFSVALRLKDKGLALADLIQAGNLGLMYAARKFVPDRGCRFSSYATWWIMQATHRALVEATHLIHIPLYIRKDLKKIWRFEKRFYNEAGRLPRKEEVEARLGTFSRYVWEAYQESEPMLSLDLPSENDASMTRGEAILDPVEDQPYAAAEANALHEALVRHMGTLKDIEWQVIDLRYFRLTPFLEDYVYQAIGKEIGGTHEAARLAEVRALRKLRMLDNGELREFCDNPLLPDDDM